MRRPHAGAVWGHLGPYYASLTPASAKVAMPA